MISKIRSLLNPLESTSTHTLEEFESHYIHTREFVRASIYWMVRDQNIDDLVQETYLKAWKSFRHFENRASFKTWIYRIAMNVTYDYFKKNKNHVDILKIDIMDSQPDKVELEDLITKALMKMSENQRESFNLFYKFGYSLEEISNLTNTKLGTVKSRLYNAKEIFGNYVKEEEGIDGR